MRGRYFGLIPRNSTFFVPAGAIRSRILAEHPEIAAVSIFTNGLSKLSIKLTPRAPVARWCGVRRVPDAELPCYFFDASGFIFAPADAASTTVIHPFRLYALLSGDAAEPLRATIVANELLPKTFDFARQLSTMGSPVISIAMHDGEVDQYLSSGTRVTYVLGNELAAYSALVSARGNLDFAGGSLDYIDLRFEGKVYTKERQQEQEAGIFDRVEE